MRLRNRCAGCERPKSRVLRTIDHIGALGGHRVFASGNDCRARTYRCQNVGQRVAAIVLALRLAFDGRSISRGGAQYRTQNDVVTQDRQTRSTRHSISSRRRVPMVGRRQTGRAECRKPMSWQLVRPLTLGSASQAYKGFDVEGLREEIEQLHVGDLVSHPGCALAFLPFG
jgi:hypothetical protein